METEADILVRAELEAAGVRLNVAQKQ